MEASFAKHFLNMCNIIKTCISWTAFSLRYCTGNNSIQDRKAQDNDIEVIDQCMYKQASKVYVCDKCEDYVFMTDSKHACIIEV